MSAREQALLPREASRGAPVFALPWHAEVLGIANVLIGTGMFSTSEWAASLGAEVARLGRGGEPDTEETYYRAALSALERLIQEKSPETAGSLVDRVEAWRRAYHNTPHGQPVTLAAAGARAGNLAHHHRHHDDDDHDDHDRAEGR